MLKYTLSFLTLCLISVPGFSDIALNESSDVQSVIYREGDFIIYKGCDGVEFHPEWDRTCKQSLGSHHVSSVGSYINAVYSAFQVDTSRPYSYSPELASKRYEFLKRLQQNEAVPISVAAQKEGSLHQTILQMQVAKEKILDFLELGRPLMVDKEATPELYLQSMARFSR